MGFTLFKKDKTPSSMILAALMVCAVLAVIGGSLALFPSPPSHQPPHLIEARDPELIDDPNYADVWISPSGKRYHRESCRFAKVKTAIAEARRRGLTPCQICNPPP